MKFLVVDDHELIREAMRGALAELDGDAAVLEASDSRETMRLIEEHPDVDLILLDLNLPDRDGFTVLSELRKSHPAISVVVMSAQQDRHSVVKALNQGALGFIPKSVTRAPSGSSFRAASTSRLRRLPARSKLGARPISDQRGVSPADRTASARALVLWTYPSRGRHGT